MAAESHPVVPLLAALRDLLAWLKAERVPGVVIGGVAASLLGRPRATRDVDVVVLLPEGQGEPFLTAGASFGFIPRLEDALLFAEQARVLLVRHQRSGIDVDIALGALPFEEEVLRRAIAVEVAGVVIPLPTPEDLIVMKAVAHRPRDAVDIESILDAHAKLDLRRIRRWVGEFANAMDMPELLADLEAIVAKRPKYRRPKRKS